MNVTNLLKVSYYQFTGLKKQDEEDDDITMTEKSWKETWIHHWDEKKHEKQP